MSQRIFQVQEPLQGEEWHPVDAWTASEAAERYAKTADDDSGGEFQDGTEILVKDPEKPDETPRGYSITVGYDKFFTAFRKSAV